MSFFDALIDERGIIGLVLQGSWITHFVLLLLLFMSAFSWALIVLKWLQFRRLGGENEEFLQIFGKESKLEHIFNLSKQFEHSSVARIFEANYREAVNFREKLKNSPPKQVNSSNILQRMTVRLARVTDRAVSEQYHYIDGRLSWLASISGSSPFIGLFGTVLGIIDSFQGIGVSGVTSLAVVAPGISEALVATAAGLLVAVPALIGYNYYRIAAKQEAYVMRNFTLELGNRMEWIVS